MTTATDTDVLERLDWQHELPCHWREGLVGSCSDSAEWLVTVVILDVHTHRYLFCTQHREASAERITDLPVTVVSVEPLR